VELLEVDQERREARIQVYNSDGIVMTFGYVGRSGNPRKDIRMVSVEDIGSARMKRSLYVPREYFLRAWEMAVVAIISPEGANESSITDDEIARKVLRKASRKGKAGNEKRNPLDVLEGYVKSAAWLSDERVLNIRGLIAQKGGKASKKRAAKRREDSRQFEFDIQRRS
jgi:hypothetical protein